MIVDQLRSDPARVRHAIMVVAVVVATVASMTGFDGQTPIEEPARSGPDDRVAGSGRSQGGDPLAGSTTVTRRAAPTTPVTPTTAPGPLACVQTSSTGPVWRLAFSDDFDGDTVDTVAWNLYDSVGNAGFGLRRPSAITVEDGLLVLTAQMIDGALVSGGMSHRRDQVYGRWEFRVRTEPDPSEATSGVVLTWPASENWPIDGENDMYETGRDPDRTPFKTFVHYGADNSQEYLTHEADGTEWHDMTMEWTADRIAIYRDGRFVGEITNPEAIPHVPHHMTVQLDAWADTMGRPVRMYVDWVRVYDLDPLSTSC